MEIKRVITINISEALAEALGISADSIFITSYEDGKLTVEIEDDEDFDFTEDDLYDEDEECECEDGCANCEYYCQHCGKCVLP